MGVVDGASQEPCKGDKVQIMQVHDLCKTTHIRQAIWYEHYYPNQWVKYWVHDTGMVGGPKRPGQATVGPPK